jgi:hypothetical membrane protein
VTRPVLERLAPLAGLVSATAIGACSIGAAVFYRGTDGEIYSPLNHYVSELGQVGVSSLAILFNAGLILGGACFATFMVGLGQARGGLGGAAYAAIGLVAGVAGALVGVFPMNQIGPHVVAASTFFFLAWIAIALASVDFLVRPQPPFGTRLAILGFVAVAASILFIWSYAFASASRGNGLEPPDVRPTIDATPLLEWAAIVGALAWTAAVAWAWRRSDAEAAA